MMTLIEPTFVDTPTCFRTSPLIRITLLGFYWALLLPLPFLATVSQTPIPVWAMGMGMLLGGVILYGALNERVVTDSQGIQVIYPRWLGWLRQGWSLAWADIQALKPRSTGQGGIVYYFVAGGAGETARAYLLPMRVVGFAQLVRIVTAKTGLDTQDVKPLSQPWMYGILLGLTLLLLVGDAWTIGAAIHAF